MRALAATLLHCLLLGGCGGGGGGAPPPAPSPAPPPATVEAAVEVGIDRGAPAVFYLVDTAGSALVTGAAGRQDLNNGTAADPSALFKIASISKLFIAAATTKLAYQNQLSLDDPLDFWLPGLAPRIENADEITIRLLAQHRSGIPDFDSQPGFSWQDAHTNVDATLEHALDLPADFAPNAQYEYSNTNYLLLGKVLDAALGHSHHDYIRDFLLAPLGLADTAMRLADVDTARMARGYWDGRDTTDQDYVIAGGSMVSTLADVSVFVRALSRGDALFTDDERAIYRDLYWFEHSGWLPGYQSVARYLADADTVIVVFVNETGGGSEDNIRAIVDDIARIVRSR